MKQSLNLRLGQQLTMTPQLQYAIRLLQLSALEIEQEVQEALESNVMLERAEDGEDGGDLGERDAGEMGAALDPLAADFLHNAPAPGHEGREGDEDRDGDGYAGLYGEGDGYAGLDASGLARGLDSGMERDPGMAMRDRDPADRLDLDLDPPLDQADREVSAGGEDIPAEFPVDSVWEEIYDSALPPSGGSNGDREGSEEYLNQRGGEETLQDRLLWQINLTPFTELERHIALAIADAIHPDGYLSAPLAEIRETAARSAGVPVDSVDVEEVEAVLKQIQHFDPPGLAARSLSECLLLQLAALKPPPPHLAAARRLVADHLEVLAVRDHSSLMRRLKIDRGELREVIALIQSLNPRPTSHLSTAPVEYVVPDVYVRRVRGRWEVELNTELVPALRVNRRYANLLRGARGEDSLSLKTHLQEARWFIKSLQSRSETLLKVATAIVDRQRAFLDQGEEHMRPLVLLDIANDLGMHESTVSRVTTRKYLHTPRGVFELKYFFSSHVGTEDDGQASSTAIRAFIKKLIDAENTGTPLSDSSIAAMLSLQGFRVARRTVAKYREGMHIPPSNERKRLV
jgi:RNA polymerase sigma-54 factor